MAYSTGDVELPRGKLSEADAGLESHFKASRPSARLPNAQCSMPFTPDFCAPVFKR